MVSRIGALLLSGVALLHQVHAQAAAPAAPAVPVPAAPAAPAAVPPAAAPAAAVPSAAAPAAAAVPPNTDGSDLYGTWSSKSMSVFTGDGFYDPVNEKFTEPKHTGISYSFSQDGHYESAYYRAIANPTTPKCPKGIIQWQHGSWEKKPNGQLHLTPIKVDGRQLFSDPCTYKNAIYTRYNATEKFKQYQVQIDAYRKDQGTKRLDLYQADGAPLMPLYLNMTTPKMLPTTTLNPLVTATAKPNKKRGELPAVHEVLFKRTEGARKADQWWWFGVFMTAGGGVMWWFF